MKTAIIGGDKRMLYLADSLLKSGAQAAVAGFDGLESLCEIVVCDPEEALSWADMAILPLMPIKNGLISMPYSSKELKPTEFGKMLGNKPVFSGFADTIRPFCRGAVYDYASREDFAIPNAALTAEGTLEIILRGYEGSVLGADALVLGYGRIGKILSRYLHHLGAHVTVAARKLSDRSFVVLNGYEATDYSELELKSGDFDIVINTVPAPVLNAAVISRMKDDVFIIDLASSPGGTDFAYAKARGLTAIHALSLPAKTAPKAAGEIIKDTIFQIIKEENGGKDHSGLCDDRLLLHL